MSSAQRVPAVGETAADFSCLDQSGADVALARLVADGPLVLVFYRGFW
jgi:peroxiredoxin